MPEGTRFSFVCLGAPGIRLIPIIKANGSRVDTDPRFRVTTFNDSTIRIEAPMGLRSSDGMQIEYVCLQDPSYETSLNSFNFKLHRISSVYFIKMHYCHW